MATILLIERAGVSRRLAASILQQAGHRVVQGAHAREALDLARRHRPQLVLMAVEAPPDEPLRAARRLRADPELAGLRVHALVARRLAAQQQRLLGSAFHAALGKPFDQRQLFRFVDAELRRGP